MYTKEIILSPYLKTGYLYFNDKDHPLAPHGDSRVLLHRHIASLKVGYWLSSDEHVHHIDENKLNNTPENLQILSNLEHIILHNCKDNIAKSKNGLKIEYSTCQLCGIIFNPHKDTPGYYCSDKCSRSSKIKNKEITKEVLDELIPNTSWIALGKMFGYSDNGIKKRAKALGCNISKGKFARK